MASRWHVTLGGPTAADNRSPSVQALDKYGDLMRTTTATPGNDFRLGACEAPPAIVSTYFGTALTAFLDGYRKGEKVEPYRAASVELDLGIGSIPSAKIPAEDRNRTSPFPYGGHRFEFRAVGSSQNVSMVNTVLCSAMADALNNFADEIENGAAPLVVAQVTRCRYRPTAAAAPLFSVTVMRAPSRLTHVGAGIAQGDVESHLQRQRLFGGVADRGGEAGPEEHRVGRGGDSVALPR